MTDLERVARAIWEHYPEKLPAWDNLNDGYTPSQACFRKMAQAAVDAMASRPAGMREALERIAMGSPDDEPPFRSMPASEMQKVARAALDAMRQPEAAGFFGDQACN